jgi:glucan phosphoethanolaminetransferase (alkaline phosphatase superfamily)
MATRWNRVIKRFLLQHRMLIFLVCTALVIAFLPFIQTKYSHLPIVIEIIFNLGLFLAIYSVSRNRKVVTPLGYLAIMSIVIIGFDELLQSVPLLLFGLFLEIIYFGIAIVIIIMHVIRYKKLTEEKIFGAISAYLLIGAMGALVYSFIEIQAPNSFRFSSGFIIDNTDVGMHRFYFSQFIYFSFVTLSTLGYGDIVPVSNQARIFASMEAIIGQLYVAVLIARLVGLHITHTVAKLYNKD